MATSPFSREAVEIKTPRVLMRTGTTADTEGYLKYSIEPANFPYGGCDATLTLEKCEKRVANFAEWTAEGKHAWIMFLSREMGDFMGFGGYNCFEAVDATAFLPGSAAAEASKAGETKTLADMGIMLDHKYWGKGYGIEIMIGLVEHARREMGAELFRTETDLGNKEWQALMKRIEVGEYMRKEKASYDANKEVLQWRWDEKIWLESKDKIQAKGRWIDIE